MKKKLLLFCFALNYLICNGQINRVTTLFDSNNQFNIPGGALNYANSLTVFNNEVYFTARQDAPSYKGLEMYKSNGNINNANLVLDINSSMNNFSSTPKNYFYSNTLNTILFTADDAPTPGNFELWKTNGTGAGTVKVHEFNPNGNGNPRRFTDFNNKVFFAVTGNNTGEELGFTDGTSAGSGIIEILAGATGSEPQQFKEFNGELYFSANGANGRELWKTDGTPSGTVQLRNINASGDSNPEKLTIYNNKLYFVADDGVNGKELWETNGTASGTVLVSDLNPGATGSNPTELTVYKGRLYFSGITAATGREIYRVGTGGGISLFRDIVAGTTGCNAEKFFHYQAQNLLLFVAGNGNTNKELWFTNGSLVFTNQLKDIYPGNSSSSINSISGSNFMEYNNKVYFTANDGTNGHELWTTDGTTNGTNLVGNTAISSLSAYPKNLVVVNNKLLFIATDSFEGYELWRYVDPILSVEDTKISSYINIHPNPVVSNFNISGKHQINEVRLYDLAGKLIKTFQKNTKNYSIKDLNSGIYIAKIKTDIGESTRKLIKK